MKIAFVVNDVATEKPGYTTTHLAWCAHKREHKVYLVGVGDLSYSSDGHMCARAKTVNDHKFKTAATFLKAVQSSEVVRISSAELDVLFLRNDPSDDMNTRNWAQNAPYIFGLIAIRDGVIVLNHPGSLSNAINKMYFQHFPEILRPQTIITRDKQEIESFFEEQKRKIILKPLQGSGGSNVFLIDKKNEHNLSQIIEAISRDGFIIAQEYLAKAVDGDIRLFLMNGHPLHINGKYAAIHRVNKAGDIRSNISAGGSVKKAHITPEILELVKVLRPKLVQDGMFLVGVDIVGDKLMEINVFSPGGLHVMTDLYEEDYCAKVIASLERKVEFKKTYGTDVDNSTLATL